MHKTSRGISFGLLCSAMAITAQGLSTSEKKLAAYVESHLDQQLTALETVVNIDSGTYNAAGVKAVGAFFRKELEDLGFSVRWLDMPEAMHRAGHLVAERIAAKGKGKRVLLICHLDTIFEGEGHRYRREGDTVWGAGSTDMKGGDMVMLYALKALHDSGALEGATVRVFMTGDEENPGLPTAVSRKELVEAAKQSDVALCFEADYAGRIVIGRRGLSTWTLKATGVQGHSLGVLRDPSLVGANAVGAGANYETARILEGIRIAYTGHPTVTINPSLVLGGTDLTFEPNRSGGSAAGKYNVVAKAATAIGDIRFITDAERDQAESKLRSLAGTNLPKTTAHFEFNDMVPGWPVTDQGQGLLALASEVTQALGQGPKVADDPVSRGFSDVNFIASLVPALDGLGPLGGGVHGPNESLNTNSLVPNTARAAVLISRLLKQAR